MAKKSFADIFGSQLQNVVGHFSGPQAPEAYDKPVNVVTAKNGVFRVEKTPVGLFKSEIAKTTTGKAIPGVSEMEAGVELLIPKIPFKYWLQTLKFYKDVHTKDKTEASLLFFWNTENVDIPSHYGPTEAQAKLGVQQGDEIKGLTQDGQLIIYCPRQKNSSGLSEFGHDGMVDWLRGNTTPLLETHSHHTMDAFWSGTDDANENMTQFYGVFGKIFDTNPKFLFRYVSGDKKVNINPNTLFDYPQIKTTTHTTMELLGVEGVEPQIEEEVEYANYNGPWPDVAYPEDWMGQHTRSYTYAGGSTYGRTGYGTPGTATKAQQMAADDYYDGYYGGAYYGGYGAGTGAGYGYDAKKNDTKKKIEDEAEEVESLEEIETSTSLVQLQAEEIINSLSKSEIKLLIFELSDYGYDQIIAEGLEMGRHSGYGYY